MLPCCVMAADADLLSTARGSFGGAIGQSVQSERQTDRNHATWVLSLLLHHNSYTCIIICDAIHSYSFDCS